MPNFYSINSLTAEQRARLIPALDLYEEIMRHNRARVISAMSTEDRAKVTAEPDLLFLRHRPGPKSALYWRLIQGLNPLEFPPPTSYSYPWYDVVEGQGSHPVLIEGIERTPENGRGVISLAQCPYLVESANQAGRDFLDWYAEASKSDSIISADLLVEGRRHFISSPVIQLQYPNWPSFELHVGRVERTGQRSWVETLDFSAPTFDGTNVKIEELLPGGDVCRYTIDGWCLRKGDGWPT